MNKGKILIISVFVAGLAVLFFAFPRNVPVLEQRTAAIGDTVISIEVADTENLRKQGLSGRQNLPDSSGMLFIFPEISVPGFWMKEMHFPIDIIWINGDGKIVSLTENAKPESFPELFYPSEPVRYVLEVPAGFSAKHNVAVGGEVRF